MKTVEALRYAVEEFEIVTEALANIISSLREEHDDARINQLMDEVELDGGVCEALKDLLTAVENLSDEDE